MFYNLIKNFLIVLLLSLFLPFFSAAQEFSSSNYKVLDPVIAPAGFSSSAGFQLWGNVSEIGVGTASASSFNLGGGFLRFPWVTTPSVAATAGASSVALSWSTSQGYLGWDISGYSVAVSNTSGGPYTYTSVGNVTSYTVNGLTPGSTYYFVVAVKDNFQNIIASSTEVSATISSNQGGSGGGGGGGGGGGDQSVGQTGVIFSGRAYPLSKVSFLKDGELVLTTIAGPDSKFTATLSGLSSGNYNFSVQGEDKDKVRSNTFSFPIYITQNITTTVSGIFIAPTLSVDKSQVAKGDNIAIFGQTSPNSEVIISINSEPEYFLKKQSGNDGVYLLNFDTSILELGKHTAKSKASVENEISNFSIPVGFTVGDKTILAETAKCPKRGDLNTDCKVNLVDFSIAAFWYKKKLNETFLNKEKENLNGDGKVDLVDFSIMAYNWTG